MTGWMGSYGDCMTGWMGSYGDYDGVVDRRSYGDCMTGVDWELWGLYDGGGWGAMVTV